MLLWLSTLFFFRYDDIPTRVYGARNKSLTMWCTCILFKLNKGRAKVDKNEVFTGNHITNLFINITNLLINITNSFINITNSFINIHLVILLICGISNITKWINNIN